MYPVDMTDTDMSVVAQYLLQKSAHMPTFSASLIAFCALFFVLTSISCMQL